MTFPRMLAIYTQSFDGRSFVAQSNVKAHFGKSVLNTRFSIFETFKCTSKGRAYGKGSLRRGPSQNLIAREMVTGLSFPLVYGGSGLSNNFAYPV